MISDVKQLAPGAALDALVATRIMGWRQETLPDGYSYWCHPEEDRWTPLEVFKPSTSIADAWQVVESMRGDHDRWVAFVGWLFEDLRPGMQSPLTRIVAYELPEAMRKLSPLTICLAALKAIGVEVEGIS